MPARVSSEMSRHSLPSRIAATSSPTGTDSTSACGAHTPLIAKYVPDDHQRAHQQEHERHAQRVELVLQRRRRVAPTAEQAQQAEDDDRRAPHGHERDADGDRECERDECGQERLTLGQPALQERMAGARRGDGVDALPDVVDLVDDVGTGVEQHAAEQRQQEGQPFEAPVDPASAAPARTGITDAV